MNDNEPEKCFEILAKLIGCAETGIFVNQPERINHIALVGEAMKETINGVDVNVECQANNPFPTVGYVTILGSDMQFTRPDILALSIKIADNFEICPRTDRKVEMNFTFYDVAKKVVK